MTSYLSLSHSVGIIPQINGVWHTSQWKPTVTPKTERIQVTVPLVIHWPDVGTWNTERWSQFLNPLICLWFGFGESLYEWHAAPVLKDVVYWEKKLNSAITKVDRLHRGKLIQGGREEFSFKDMKAVKMKWHGKRDFFKKYLKSQWLGYIRHNSEDETIATTILMPTLILLEKLCQLWYCLKSLSPSAFF